MTPYDIWLYFLQTFLNTIKFFKDHPTVPGLIILIMRQNSIRKVINSRLPKQFQDTVDTDILEIKDDLKLIKKHLGVIGEWQSNGQVNGSKRAMTPIFFTLYGFLLNLKKHPKRRLIKMNSQNINFKTLIPTLIMALYLILQLFGIRFITNVNVDAVVNAISAIGTVIGIYMPHTKAADISNSIVQVLPDIQNSIHKVIADPNTSYAKMVPVISEVHTALTSFCNDMQTGKVTDATREAMSAYLTFQAYLQTIKPTPIEVPSAEKVGA